MYKYKLNVYIKAPFTTRERKIIEKNNYELDYFDKLKSPIDNWKIGDDYVVYKSKFFISHKTKVVQDLLHHLWKQGVSNIKGTIEALEVLP